MKLLDLFCALLGLAFGAAVLQLARRQRISAREAMPWLGLSAVMLLMVALRRPLDVVAGWLGVQYAPALWLVVGLIGLLSICLRLAVEISKLQAKVVRLAQEVALLQREEKR